MKYRCIICHKEFSNTEGCPHIKEFGLDKCLQHNIIEKLIDGEDILKIRKHFNYTQQQLAKIIGVSTPTLSRWESGERKVREWVSKVLEATFGKNTLEKILEEGKDDSRENNRKQAKKVSSSSC